MTDGNPNYDQQAMSEDERLHPRYECELEAFVTFRGAPWRCWIRDLSLGGAGLEPALPAMLAQAIELTCPSFGFDDALAGRVVNVTDRRTCEAFDLDAERLEALTRFMAANVVLA